MRGLFRVHEALESFGVLEAGSGRRARAIVAMGASVGGAVSLVIVAGVVVATIRHTAASQAYWTVSGPPCPTASPAQIRRIGRPLAQVVEYGEGHFARISGAVVCNDLTDNLFGVVQATVCQFNSPRALWVSSAGGSRYYDVPGSPATVTVSRSRPPRCVLAANYTGE